MVTQENPVIVGPTNAGYVFAAVFQSTFRSGGNYDVALARATQATKHFNTHFGQNDHEES